MKRIGRWKTYNAEVNTLQTPRAQDQFSAYPSQFWPCVRYKVPEAGPVGVGDGVVVVLLVVVVVLLVVVVVVVVAFVVVVAMRLVVKVVAVELDVLVFTSSKTATFLGQFTCLGSLSHQLNNLFGAPMLTTGTTLSQAGFEAGYPGASNLGLHPGNSSMARVIPTSSCAIGESREEEQASPAVSFAYGTSVSQR